MTLRDNLTPEQAWAHAVRDDVRDVLSHSHQDVSAALRVLGHMA